MDPVLAIFSAKIPYEQSWIGAFCSASTSWSSEAKTAEASTALHRAQSTTHQQCHASFRHSAGRTRYFSAPTTHDAPNDKCGVNLPNIKMTTHRFFVMLSHVRKHGNRPKFSEPKPGILFANNNVTHLKIRASFCIPYFAANSAAKSWRPCCVSARRFPPFESCPDRTKWSRNGIEIKKRNKTERKIGIEEKTKSKIKY